MSFEQKVKEQLKELGIKPHHNHQIASLGIELTICQLVVVVFSIITIALLFVPLFFLQEVMFMVVFFGISFVCLTIGVWFWINRATICEHPEEYQD